MPSLFVFRGNNQGMRFELEAEALSLGREAGNDVQLHDTEVSRRHAELRRSDKTFTLIDQGSSNGTYVNGQRIQSHQLVNGDEVQMGGTVMLYTCLGDESTGDLADKIDIIARRPSGDQSRIVRSMSQAEGSRILSDDSAVAASPWLARARSNLQVMYRTALAVSHTLDIDQLLNRIMQLIFEWVEADRGCIMLVNPDTGKLEPKVRRNRKGVKAGERITISKTILDYVMEHNEGVLTSDASEDDRWNPAASILQMGICEAICVPMQGRYNMVGVIYIDTSTSPQRLIQQQSAKFTEEHLKLMIAIAHQAALAVEDTRYYSAMVQAERLAAVGQTIATLSHHIKNILQGIRGGSYLIKEGLSQHDETMVGKGWEFVEKNQERISNLVMDMLTFSKDREPELVPSDLNEVAADVVELMTVASQGEAGRAAVHARDGLAPADLRSGWIAPGHPERGDQRHRRLRPECRRGRRNGRRGSSVAQGAGQGGSQRRVRSCGRGGPSDCGRQRLGHSGRAARQDLHAVRFAQGEPRHRVGAGRQPEDHARTRRPDSRREPTGRGQPLYAGVSRHRAGRAGIESEAGRPHAGLSRQAGTEPARNDRWCIIG